ncbi:MAG: ABC transporter substrate-binding protein, partial [Hyphomicrobiaceae bacterium]
PAFHELAAALELTVNVHALASLPDDLAEIVRQAAAAAAHATLAEFSYRNARAFPALGQRGVEVLSFPDAVVDALARESEAALSAVAASSALAGDTVASLRRFRDEAARYGRACLGRGLAMRERALIR